MIITACKILSALVGAMCQPNISEMPILLTSYWPFIDGELVAYNGQADIDPTRFANMQQVTIDKEWQAAACIDPWIGVDSTSVLTFVYDGDERVTFCHDAFGALSHRAPHYNEYLDQWVIPVDIMTKEPLFVLIVDYDRQWESIE